MTLVREILLHIKERRHCGAIVTKLPQRKTMPKKQPTSQLHAAMSFAHRENIERYKRILRTHLTENERGFLQRRLAEEQAALAQLAGIAVPFGKSYFAA
jgi:hypothetical protein